MNAAIGETGAIGAWMAAVLIEPDLEVSLLACLLHLEVAAIHTVRD